MRIIYDDKSSLPRRDHEGDCTGTCHRIHRTRFACSTRNWARRVDPGTIRFSSAPFATWTLQFTPSKRKKNSYHHHHKTLTKPPHCKNPRKIPRIQIPKTKKIKRERNRKFECEKRNGKRYLRARSRRRRGPTPVGFDPIGSHFSPDCDRTIPSKRGFVSFILFSGFCTGYGNYTGTKRERFYKNSSLLLENVPEGSESSIRRDSPRGSREIRVWVSL